MKIHNISILGALIGLGIIISSTIRWIFIWYDPSNALLAIFIGIIGIVLSYIYSWMRNADERFDKLSKQYQAIVSIWTKNEKHDIKSIAFGEEIE